MSGIASSDYILYGRVWLLVKTMKFDVLFLINVEIVVVGWKYTYRKSFTSLSFIKKGEVQGYTNDSSSSL